VSLAKIRAEHSMRLAGLRDRTQSERYTPPEEVAPKVTAAAGSMIFVISSANPAPRPPPRTIDHDAE
jgi:hypothetical protein